jgi:hypothetical protein
MPYPRPEPPAGGIKANYPGFIEPALATPVDKVQSMCLEFRPRGPHRQLKLNLMVSADCEPASASRIRRSSESSTADHHSKLNGTVLFGMHYWPECLRGQAATYRKLAEQTDDLVVKKTCLS